MRGGYTDYTQRICGVPEKYRDMFLDLKETVNAEQEQYKAKLLQVMNKEYWCLVVLGSVGNGKTTLACSSVNYWNVRREHGYYITFADLCGKLKDFEHGKVQDDTNKYSLCPYLVIDEFRKEDLTDFTKTQLQAILNKRYENGKRTILISNSTPEEFGKMLDEYVKSRLREGIVQLMTAPDMRGKAEKRETTNEF